MDAFFCDVLTVIGTQSFNFFAALEAKNSAAMSFRAPQARKDGRGRPEMLARLLHKPLRSLHPVSRKATEHGRKEEVEYSIEGVWAS